jgi:hypothetical protein
MIVAMSLKVSILTLIASCHSSQNSSMSTVIATKEET